MTIKNAKSYDALAKSDTVTGTIMGNVIKHRGDEYYDIKVGSGQYTARVKDISLED